MTTVLILGAGIMQGPSLRAARRLGWRSVAADANPSAPCRSLADRFELVDLKDRDGMLALARRLREGEGLDAVFTAGTDFSTTVSHVCEHLGLPGVPLAAAARATDKHLMRNALRAAGVPCPGYAEFDGRGDPAEAARGLRPPRSMPRAGSAASRGRSTRSPPGARSATMRGAQSGRRSASAARFDPAREGLRQAQGKPGAMVANFSAVLKKITHRVALPDLSRVISKITSRTPFLGMLFAEIRLLLKGRAMWWWLITIGLNIAILTSPGVVTTNWFLPFAWLWPIATLSGMGNRERKNNTYQMVFSSTRPVLRQLPVAWLAGVMVTAMLVISGAIYPLIHGDAPGLLGWAGGVIFVPALALLLGVISSGSRVFEVVYVLWWYVGPLQKAHWVDFTHGAPLVYLLATFMLMGIAMLWRSRQVRV